MAAVRADRRLARRPAGRRALRRHVRRLRRGDVAARQPPGAPLLPARRAGAGGMLPVQPRPRRDLRAAGRGLRRGRRRRRWSPRPGCRCSAALYVVANLFLLLLAVADRLRDRSLVAWLQRAGDRALRRASRRRWARWPRRDAPARALRAWAWCGGSCRAALIYSVLPMALFAGGAGEGAAVMLGLRRRARCRTCWRPGGWSGRARRWLDRRVGALRRGAAAAAFALAGIWRALFGPMALGAGAVLHRAVAGARRRGAAAAALPAVRASADEPVRKSADERRERATRSPRLSARSTTRRRTPRRSTGYADQRAGRRRRDRRPTAADAALAARGSRRAWPATAAALAALVDGAPSVARRAAPLAAARPRVARSRGRGRDARGHGLRAAGDRCHRHRGSERRRHAAGRARRRARAGGDPAREHGALAGNQSFALANVLVAVDAIDLARLPGAARVAAPARCAGVRRGAAGAGVARRRRSRSRAGGEAVHLRFSRRHGARARRGRPLRRTRRSAPGACR